MIKADVIAFFDKYAPQWDSDMIRDDKIIAIILDNANVHSGSRVLDVACGTGVLIPDYLARNVASVTAVDISPEMVKIAQEKFQQSNVHIICADIEAVELKKKFDSIVIYNAFPHFPDPENLIRTLASLLEPGGALTVAHGMSREQIDQRHQGSASKVSIGLMHEDDLANLFEKYLKVTVKISDERMFQVVGVSE